MTDVAGVADVLVVGGGLAGLTAGVTAARAGSSVIVLEGHQPGGRSRTIERDGFTLNMGGHALYAGADGMRILRELGVNPAGVRPPLKTYKLLMNGELHVMPVGPGSILRTTALMARSKAELAKLLGLLPRVDPAAHAGKTVDEWIAGHSLRPDAEAVLRAIIRISTYGPDFGDFSADAAIMQLQRAASSGVLYLHGGWAQLIDGLRSQVDVRSRMVVREVRADGNRAAVDTDGGTLTAKAVIVATGTPASALALLPGHPAWEGIGEPLTAATLDVGVRGIPQPGFVLGVDEPVYGTTQSPPARQAPPGDAVVAIIRYGARNAVDDRRQLDTWLRHVGVVEEAIVVSRFMASMNVTGAIPRAKNGGLAGRPSIDATTSANLFIAGDWVGPDGLLADASFASGHAAGVAAARVAQRSATMVA